MKVDDACTTTFPAVDDGLQAGVIVLAYENVNVIGHDAPCDESISFVVIEDECFLNDAGDFRMAKFTTPVARVFVASDAAKQFVSGGFLDLGVGRVELWLKLLFPRVDDVGGKGVGLTEGDGLERASVVSMGQIAASMVTLGFHPVRVTLVGLEGELKLAVR